MATAIWPPCRGLPDDWVTINEPNVYAYAASTVGVSPPGEKTLGRALDVLGQLIRAHARAYAVIHRLRPTARVGIAHPYRGLHPAPRWNPVEVASAALRHRVFNEAVPRAVHDGWLRLPGRGTRLREAAGAQGLFGLPHH